MKNLAVVTAILVCLSVPASAQSIEVHQPSHQAEIAVAPNNLSQYGGLRIGPNGVLDLKAYGERFERTIKMVEAEATIPSWGWEDGCGHDKSDDELALNW